MRNTIMFRMALALLFSVFVLSAHAEKAKELSTGLVETTPVAAQDASSAEWQAQQKAAEEAAAKAVAAPAADASVAPGQLGPSDKIKLTVFGEEDLSGEFEIDNTGSLMVPLAGEIKAKGLTPRELEAKITKVLGSGYLVNPRVSIEVLNFRPFFILGEVNKPGSYPWSNDMTVINAVALGGGYTPRASTGKVIIRRATDPNREENWAEEDAKVYPGDVIRVDERFF